MYDRQVHPGQTKAVKGQNSKTLVTAGTIKRPLPCPVKGIEKTEDRAHKVKRKTVQEKKRKKIRTKTERKEKKTKKERRKLVRKSMHQ